MHCFLDRVAEGDTFDKDMKWIMVMFAVAFCMHGVIDADIGDVIRLVADDRKNFDTLGGHANKFPNVSRQNTVSDDVRCTTIDDVAAARKSLCPAQCKCSPLDGQETLTTLTVNCSGVLFNQSTSLKFSHDLTLLLSLCSSELRKLTIVSTPLTAVPEVICQLFNIESLDLNSNQLASLPSNCFTRMRNLTSFSASGNRLTTLQVGLTLKYLTYYAKMFI